MEADKASTLKIEDIGKWLPFAFDLTIVDAIKLSSDEDGDFTYNCTTLYTSGGDVFVIDTPYSLFLDIYKRYRAQYSPYDEEEDGGANEGSDGDLNL